MSLSSSSKGIVPPRGSAFLEPLRRRPRAFFAAAMGIPLAWLGGIAALWYYQHPATAPRWLPALFSLLLLLGTALAIRCLYLLRTERPQPHDEGGGSSSGPVLW